MSCGILHNFEYAGKSESLKIADQLLFLPRFISGCKSINCYELNEEHAYFYESRSIKNRASIIALKTAALGTCLIGSPFILCAIAFKYFDNENTRILNRYVQKLPTDKFRFKARLGNSLIVKAAVKVFMHFVNLDKLTASMQIHGDKILRTFSSSGSYEGGLSLPIAQLIQDKLTPYLNRDETPFSLACGQAKFSLDTFKNLSEKMTPIMMSRLLPLGFLFNSQSYTHDLAKDLSDDLKRLHRGQAVMMPFTFYAPTRGYRTIVSSFKNCGHHSYEWTIYRSSVESEGRMHKHSFKSSKIPAIRLRGLKREHIKDITFLSRLIDFATFKTRDQGEQFFQFVKDFEEDTSGVSFSRSVPKSRPQNSDTYSLRSLNFALKDLMGKDAYAQFTFLMKADDLLELKRIIESNNITNPSQLNDASNLFAFAQEEMQRKADKVKRLFDIDSWLTDTQKEAIG